MTKTTLIAVLAAAVLVQTAIAGAQINFRANGDWQAFLDDDAVGQAPLQLNDIAPGFHRLRVQNAATHEVRVYDFYSPAGATIVKDIDLMQAGAVPPPADLPGEPPPAVAGEAQQQAAEAASAEREAYEAGRRAERERTKVRTRNTLLGAAAANEIFNKGSSKSTLRGVTLGGALLNELFRK